MGPATQYDRQLYAGLPGWYNGVYAIAVGAGLLGSFALLARSAMARWLFVLSLIAIIVIFGYLFLATDVIAVKGAAATLPFPILIALIAIFAIRSEEHTSELQSLMRISYAVFCLKKKTTINRQQTILKIIRT